MKLRVLRFLKIGLATYLAVCFVLFAIQRSMIYFPPPPEKRLGEETPFLEVEGARLRLSVVEREGDAALLYFGGNAENVALSLPDYAEAFPGHSIYALHYRGYSGSTGRPTEAALHADAAALYDRVRGKHARITLVGRSLGTGVAVRLAAERDVERLVLVTPFDSLVNVAQQLYWYLPVKLLLIDRYESWRYAPQITAPTHIIAAANDEIIPAASSQRLLEAFPEGTAELTTIRSSNHNSISLRPDFWPAIIKLPAER
jgi:uncharacterized protein